MIILPQLQAAIVLAHQNNTINPSNSNNDQNSLIKQSSGDCTIKEYCYVTLQNLNPHKIH